MAPSGSSSTLSMPPFSTGLQIPDHGLAFSGLPGPQQVFPQNLGGGSLMPGSSGGLRMRTALRAPHSMSMLMSSGGQLHSRVCCFLRAQEGVQQSGVLLCSDGFALVQGQKSQPKRLPWYLVGPPTRLQVNTVALLQLASTL